MRITGYAYYGYISNSSGLCETTIEVEETSIVDKFKNLKIITTIPDNSKVYFHVDVVFPRERLRQYGKPRKIEITRSPEKADYIVYSKAEVSRRITSIRNVYTGELDKPIIIQSEWALSQFKKIGGKIINKYLEKSSIIIDSIFDLTKSFIDVEDLNNQCLEHSTFTYEEYLSLKSMLSSSDPLTVTIGMKTLFAKKVDSNNLVYSALLYDKFYNMMSRDYSALFRSISGIKYQESIDKYRRAMSTNSRNEENVVMTVLIYCSQNSLKTTINRELLDSIIIKRIEEIKKIYSFYKLDVSYGYEILDEYKNCIIYENEEQITDEELSREEEQS